MLTGCTGDEPEPEAQASEPSSAPVTTAPSAEPTPSPSPSATGPAKPERPAAMDRKDEKGAAAAVEYILGLEQPMMVSGNTAEWERHSHRSCDYCAARLDQAMTIARRGDVFTGGSQTVEIDTVYQRDEVTGIWPFDVTIQEAATTITDVEGEVLFESDDISGERRIEVGLVDGEWVLVERAEIPKD
nr:DUF6318 family protein [Isoptericola sediminis]